MKKLFTMLVVSFCGTMAYAQTGAVSVNDVTIVKGSTTQMEVTINNAKNNTAFQFDLALPAGVSVKEAKLNGEYGETRKLLNGPVLNDKNEPRQRFLSYDDNNALLADGAKVIVTLAATEEAETAALTGEGFVVVTPEGNSVGDGETASADVKVLDGGVPIPLSQIGSTTFTCDVDLDFSSLTDVKAYICTGYDVSTNILYFCRVKDVPANTPIYVTGPENETVIVPVGTSVTYYGENFLIGDAKNTVTVPAETDDYLCWALGKSQGWMGVPAGRTLEKGKAYARLPKKVAKSAVSEGAVDVTMSQTGNLAYVGKYDFDFNDVEGLKAYTVMGFAKGGTIWIARVKTVTAGTPLFLRGSNDETYSVPSVKSNIVWANMLRGDADNTSVVPVTSGDYINWIYSKKTGYWGPLASDQSSFPAGTAYLPLLKSYAQVASARGITSENANPVVLEAEVLEVKLGGMVGEDDELTGIRAIGELQGDDVWHNLSGQRISAPTKKGLYIKNGKKVIVK